MIDSTGSTSLALSGGAVSTIVLASVSTGGRILDAVALLSPTCEVVFASPVAAFCTLSTGISGAAESPVLSEEGDRTICSITLVALFSAAFSTGVSGSLKSSKFIDLVGLPPVVARLSPEELFINLPADPGSADLAKLEAPKGCFVLVSGVVGRGVSNTFSPLCPLCTRSVK